MKNLPAAVLVVLALAACRNAEEPAGTQTANRGARSSAPAATTTGTEIGSVLPEYSAMWLDGSKFDVQTRRDKIVMLNIWATWCPPCREEIPELQAIHDKYAPQKFEVIGVSVDESVEAVKHFVDEKKMTYPIVLDPDGKLADMLQASMLPTTIMLDRDGKILWKRVGAIVKNDQELIQAIEKAL